MRQILNVNASIMSKHIKNESVAVAVTSPPYNLGIENESHLADYEFDRRTWPDYIQLAEFTSRELHKVMMPGGRVWVNIQPAAPWNVDDPKSRRRISLDRIWHNALQTWFEYRDTIVWVQDSFDGACAWGSWARPSAPNLRGGHELILCYYKPHPDTDGWRRPTPDRWKGWTDEREGLGGDLVDMYRNVWQVKPARSDYKATFPLEIPARCIRLSAWPDETVLDPFVGTGTTLVAAEQIAAQWGVGRTTIGVEKSEEMAKVAKEAE